MLELNAEGEEKGEDELDKRSAVVKELKVSRFIVEIDGDGAVCAYRFGCFPHVSPPSHQVSSAEETPWEEHIELSRQS